MRKKIIISEEQMNSPMMKEIALAASMSKKITKELDGNKTPLSKNIFFPDDYSDEFIKKIILYRFKETKNELYKIGLMHCGDDVQNLLPSLIEECKRLEKPIRRNLEKIAYNFIIETFNIPEGVVNLTVNLNDNISNTTLNVRVQAEDTEYEFEDLKHKRNLTNEIHKRKLLNCFMAGGALKYASAIKRYIADIYDLEPKLPELYRNIIALNEYMLFCTNDIEINDKNKNQLGMSNIILGTEQLKTEVKVEAVIFPILIYEEIKAFLELSASHGLPKNKEEAQYVMGKCDYIQAEPWYMRIGPVLWDIFTEMLGEIKDSLIPYIFMEISKLPIDLFEIAMHEILSKTKKGKKILQRIKEKHENEDEYQNFKNRMDIANTNISLIADENILENILGKETINEISIKDAYHRFYSDIPQEDYQKIIAATKNTSEVLSADAKWVLNLYKRKSPRLMEDLYKLHNEMGEGCLDVFNRLKELRKITGPESDINRYKSISELCAFTNQFNIDDLYGNNSERKKRVMRDEFVNAKDQIRKLYEDDEWLVVMPLSYEASCYWGDGTDWCTAYKDDDSYYEQYSDEGPLYININKQTGKKYQFHFESEQFMDKDDDEIDIPVLENIGANNGLKMFYINLFTKIGNDPEIYLKLFANKNEYGWSYDNYKIGDKWYYFNYENDICKYLDFANDVWQWEQIEGMYVNDAYDNIALVKGHDGKFNFINGYGNLITRSWFDDYGSWDYTYGVLPVKRKGKWNMINHYGTPLSNGNDFDNIKEIYDEYDEIEYYIGTIGSFKYHIERDGTCRLYNEYEED